MGRRKDRKSMSGRVDFRAEPDWIDLVEEAAKRLGLGMSAYIRLATNERLSRDGLVAPARPPDESAKPRKRWKGE
jgi:hypothetical protein